MKIPMAVLGIAGFFLASVTPASSQIMVRVTDRLTENPVPLAAVQTLDADSVVLETRSTGADGVATMTQTRDVRAVRVMALSYVSQQVEVQGRRAYGTRVLRVTLTPAALELDSIAVEVESGRPVPGRLQFTERRDAHSGIFLDPFDVGLKTKYGVVHVFTELEGVRGTGWRGARQMPTIVTNMGSGCLRYRLNNLKVRSSSWNQWPLSGLLPQDVMAVEIYRHFGEVPEHLKKDAYPPSAMLPCGLVVIWTKEAW